MKTKTFSNKKPMTWIEVIEQTTLDNRLAWIEQTTIDNRFIEDKEKRTCNCLMSWHTWLSSVTREIKKEDLPGSNLSLSACES